jgi:isoquinoline 1-oxidoreductase beta subunit
MSEAPRVRGALELAAEKAGWGTPLPDGVGRGIAAWSCFGSHVAEVAEVEVAEDQSVKVRRIVCAVDCGHALNPRNLTAQVEGGITLALTYTLKGAITIEDGGAKEGNFHDYPLLQLREMPKVEVHIVPSTEDPGGIGEPGVPPVAPAVANAIFAATGRRVRKLPIVAEGFRIG